MPHTDHLEQLIKDLHTDQKLQDEFRNNPSDAVEKYEITGHERDAVITHDLDDFVALGIVGSIEDLPEVMREQDREYNVPEELQERVERPKGQVLPADPPEIPLQPEPGMEPGTTG